MCKTLDNFFGIMRTISNSVTPMSILELSEVSGLNIRTCQRHCMRLAQEGLVDFRAANNGTNAYEYARVGYWDNTQRG